MEIPIEFFLFFSFNCSPASTALNIADCKMPELN